MTRETYRRDDGWAIEVVRDGDVLTSITRVPIIVHSPPDPITWEYALRALTAHGYALDAS